jgi:hypothetical protein
MPYVLSIEVKEGETVQHGFHLGTQLPLARQIAVEMFHARANNGLPVVTVALMQNGKVVDVYSGKYWDSEYAVHNQKENFK